MNPVASTTAVSAPTGSRLHLEVDGFVDPRDRHRHVDQRGVDIDADAVAAAIHDRFRPNGVGVDADTALVDVPVSITVDEPVDLEVEP